MHLLAFLLTEMTDFPIFSYTSEVEIVIPTLSYTWNLKNAPLWGRGFTHSPPPWSLQASHSAAHCCTNWANSAGKMTAAKIGFTAMASADNSVIIQTVVEWLSFTLAWVNYQTVKALLRDSIIMWTALVIVTFTETHSEFSLLSKVIPVRSHLQLQTLFHLSFSTYKFSRLISIHCFKELVERMW